MSDMKVRGIASASQYLVKRGYKILESDWKQKKHQADIIAMDGDILVFVDVEMSADQEAGFPTNARTAASRARRENAALAYLRSGEFTENVLVRFDELYLLALDDERYLVRHHLNAFGSADEEALSEAA